MNLPEPEFRSLVQSVIEGSATAGKRAQLSAELRSSPERRADYVRQLRIDALLRFAGGRRNVAPVPSTSARSRPAWIGTLAWAAAVAVTAAGVAWGGRSLPEVDVVRSSALAASEWPAGVRRPVEKIALAQGEVQLRLRSGVSLEIVAPAEVEVVNAMHVRVVRGQVTADAGERGRGFVVETAETRIVDLGTRFGVAAAATGHTDVVVFQGEVEVFERSARRAPGPRARLVEGEAVRVDSRQHLSRIMSVASGPGEDRWSTGGDDSRAVIAAVRDNQRNPDANYFYRIVAGGLHEDAPAFVAKRHEWNGLDPTGLPGELAGADLVQTIPTDRFNDALEIAVSLARPAVLYVLFDSRTPTPAWLETEFKDTGLRIGLENAPVLESGRPVGRGAGVGHMAPFSVWKRLVPAAGTVRLGPPRATPDDNPLWMYGIAAKPL